MYLSLKVAGFQGDQIYLAAHSQTGEYAQDYAFRKPHFVKATILMGNVISDKYRYINKDGKTEFNFTNPVFTIAAELDGVNKVSKAGLAYWHQFVNNATDNEHKFPIMWSKYMTHSDFMKRSMVPDWIK